MSTRVLYHPSYGTSIMITPWYVAVETFSPEWGDAWDKYIRWSGLDQLQEVISLDGCLCPNVIQEFTAEDWKHNVHEDCFTHFFLELEYLQARVTPLASFSLLAALVNPEVACDALSPAPGFQFKGYDLVDQGVGISALTNCGGFPLAFANHELSSVGLVSNLSRAREIQQSLLQHYPNEDHADCDIWALWRMEKATAPS